MEQGILAEWGIIGPLAEHIRRWHMVEERRRIVEETLMPGVGVALVARQHGVNAKQVFQRLRLNRAGDLVAPGAAVRSR